MVTRTAWRAALKSTQFPRDLRAIRATTLMLADAMNADGRLAIWKADMTERTGLPARTVERHIGRAVSGGWLYHLARGGQGRPGAYQATTPTRNSPPLMADNFVNSPPSSTDYSHGIVRHLVAESRKKSPSGSEVKALDRNRPTKTDHSLSRTEPEHDESQERIDEEAPAHSADVVDSLSARATTREATGNPICQHCGRPTLYAPKSIARGICAACIQLEVRTA